MQRRSVRLMIMLSLLAIIAQAVFAIPNFELSEGIARIGEQIYRLLKSYYAVYGLLVVISIVLFRALYIGLIKKVPFFQGEGAEGLSGPGRIFATSLAFITVLALAAGYRNSTALQRIGDIGGNIGTLLTIVIASLYLFNSRRNESTSWRTSLFWTTLIVFAGAMFYGSYLWLIFMVLLIIYAGSLVSGMGGSVGEGSPFVRQSGGSGGQRFRRLRGWWRRARDKFSERMEMLNQERGFIGEAMEATKVEYARTENIGKQREYINGIEKRKKDELNTVRDALLAPGEKDFGKMRGAMSSILQMLIYQETSLSNGVVLGNKIWDIEHKHIKELEKANEISEREVRERKLERLEDADAERVMRAYTELHNRRLKAIDDAKAARENSRKLFMLFEKERQSIESQKKHVKNLIVLLNKRQAGNVRSGVQFVQEMKQYIEEDRKFEHLNGSEMESIISSLEHRERDKANVLSEIARLNENLRTMEVREKQAVEKKEKEAESSQQASMEIDRIAR